MLDKIIRHNWAADQGAAVPSSGPLGGVLSVKQPDFDLLARLSGLSDEEKHQRILAGLADVDAGRLILHEEVISWTRSLLESSHGSSEIE